MSRIAVHHTGTSDQAWDEEANRARLKTDGSLEHAWRDPGSGLCRFLHHEVDESGELGEANVHACIAGIASMSRAERAADIPEADREGVIEHLAAHLEDAGVGLPDLQLLPAPGREDRAYKQHELRVGTGDDDQRRIVGRVAPFNVLSEQLGGFRERIRPGAFRKTIKESDIRALWNHDRNYVLGRTKANTLKLEEDDRGLLMEAYPPDTQWARDWMVSIDRGDVDEMSFGFETVRDEWAVENGQPVRTLMEVRLFDVSPVTFPAYPETNVQVRSVLGMEWREIAGALSRLETGGVTDQDRRLLESLVQQVGGKLTAAPAEGGHPADDDDSDSQVRARLDLRRRRLELIEFS